MLQIYVQCNFNLLIKQNVIRGSIFISIGNLLTKAIICYLDDPSNTFRFSFLLSLSNKKISSIFIYNINFRDFILPQEHNLILFDNKSDVKKINRQQNQQN